MKAQRQTLALPNPGTANSTSPLPPKKKSFSLCPAITVSIILFIYFFCGEGAYFITLLLSYIHSPWVLFCFFFLVVQGFEFRAYIFYIFKVYNEVFLDT
jgi:hypothetical protein